MPMDYTKVPSDKRVTVFMGPGATGAVGITDVGEPLAAELNNTGGTSMVINASPSISWNDWDFGIQASETVNEPSFADEATFEEFGQTNYGGDFSHFLPREYDDASNNHSLVYDLTDEQNTELDVALRIDGDVLNTTAAVDGDLVSVYRVATDSEQNPFTPGESKRRTVGTYPLGELSHFIPVGDQAITVIGGTYTAGSKGRIRAKIQGRDVTCMLDFSSDDPEVILVYPGGFFEITGVATDTATVTISHPYTSDIATVNVVVA
jgi:hypothetical protein